MMTPLEKAEQMMKEYESLDKRYVLEKDPNIDWLKDHGFKEVIFHGTVDHYEYEILYQFKNEKKRIITVCAYYEPQMGWRVKAVQNVKAIFEPQTASWPKYHADVRDGLLEIEDEINRMIQEIDLHLGHEYSGLFMNL